MGASGTDTFDDDDAMDWIGAFLDAPSEELIYETLERARPYCESGAASQALAAAEVVAFLRGAPSSGLLQMLEAHGTETFPLKRSPRHERLAIDAIDNISAASELQRDPRR
jgi:hypothetical protein